MQATAYFTGCPLCGMYDTVYPRVHQAQKKNQSKKAQGKRHKVQGKLNM
jgi:hypothetical protein